MNWLKKKLLDDLKLTHDPRAVEELIDDIADLSPYAHDRGDLEDVQAPEGSDG